MQTTVDVGALLTELRDIIDQREKLSTADSKLAERKSQIERELISASDALGLASFATEGLSVKIEDAMRYKYDPERWGELVKWAVDTDNLAIIQRRMTDARISSLIEDGVAIPDCITPDPYKKLTTRRK